LVRAGERRREEKKARQKTRKEEDKNWIPAS
jgi:hypothetical protein